MKKYLFLLFSVFFLAACSSDTEEPFRPEPDKTPGEQAPITILSYFVADNSLDGDLMYNIIQSYQALLEMDQETTYLVYWDGKGAADLRIIVDYQTERSITVPAIWKEPRVVKFTSDGHGKVNGKSFREPSVDSENYRNEFIQYYTDIVNSAETICSYPSQVSTDTDVMAKVLKDMVAVAPAEKLGLIFASHGSGWLPTITGGSRSFGEDGFINCTITTDQMAKALQATGRYFDFLLFDSCMMGCAEVAYDFKDVVNYLIASPINVPKPGFPYSKMFQHLNRGNLEGYSEACDIYIDRYQKEGNRSIMFGTISIMDCQKIVPLVQALKKVILSHRVGLTRYDPTHLQQYGEKGSNFYGLSFDLLQFVRDIHGEIPADLQAAFDEFMTYANFVDKSYLFPIDGDNFCGVGLYVPMSNKYYWNDYFKTIPWYTAAGWDQVPYLW